MTKEQIDRLISGGIFPEKDSFHELVETHISWVILCTRYVYKVKKPVHYSFLDFSTPERRKYFCDREVVLNNRLTENIYLDVQPVYEQNGFFHIGRKGGQLADHAVRMNKIDRDRQMDRLLVNDRVSGEDMKRLAGKMAFFHNSTEVIHKKDVLDVQPLFNDLETVKETLSAGPGDRFNVIIDHVLAVSDKFIAKNKSLLEARRDEGLFRDCHGDLHSRNIFLLPDPQPFDCIEFNDDFRQIDILNELAFLCMDLEAFDRPDLAATFLREYNRLFPVLNDEREQRLFTYYKSYRANVRAKVNSLRAKDTTSQEEKNKFLIIAGKYLHLTRDYLDALNIM